MRLTDFLIPNDKKNAGKIREAERLISGVNFERKEDTLLFPVDLDDKEKYGKIQQAKKVLFSSGITFDTAYDLVDKNYEWQMDWSLKGAKVIK